MVIKAGAGILFYCPEDETVFLAKRSKHVNSGVGIWATPGGGIDDGESAWRAACREVIEECGSLPHFGPVQNSFTQINKDGFRFTTFAVFVSKKDKEDWEYELNFENDEADWFPTHTLPHPMFKGAPAIIFKLI